MPKIVTLTRRGRWLLAAACVIAVAVAGCGGSSTKGRSEAGSAQAKQLLRETFTGHHTVNSGTMTVTLTLTPTGSSTLKSPITISFSGPFQSNGAGKIPDSDFTIAGEAEGHTVQLRLISAGGHGYVTVDGDNYQLPQADYERIESSFTSVSGSSGTKTSALGKLGIDPMSWLKASTIAGNATVDGTATTRINADVSSTALMVDFNKILSNASSLGLSSGGKLPSKLTPAELDQLQQTIGNPKLSVWSANGDHSLRKLELSSKLNVPGAMAGALDGLSGLGVDFSLNYGDVNQPQKITAPTDLKPYSQFQDKVRTVEAALEYILIETESGTASSGSSGTDQKYSQCIQNAAGNVTKMQKCSSLLSAGS